MESLLHTAPTMVVGCSALQPGPCSAGRVSTGAEGTISQEDAGLAGPPAPGFSSVNWIMGPLLPGLAKSTGDNERLANLCSCPHSGHVVHTMAMAGRQSRRAGCTGKAAADKRPSLLGPRTLGFIFLPPQEAHCTHASYRTCPLR